MVQLDFKATNYMA
jgi:hypothetical protein